MPSPSGSIAERPEPLRLPRSLPERPELREESVMRSAAPLLKLGARSTVVGRLMVREFANESMRLVLRLAEERSAEARDEAPLRASFTRPTEELPNRNWSCADALAAPARSAIAKVARLRMWLPDVLEILFARRIVTTDPLSPSVLYVSPPASFRFPDWTGPIGDVSVRAPPVGAGGPGTISPTHEPRCVPIIPMCDPPFSLIATTP